MKAMKDCEYIPPCDFFKRLKVDARRLAPFGFARNGSVREYLEDVADGSLVCRITIDQSGNVRESVVDAATGDEYVQHRIAGASGKFVGKVRQEVMDLMARVARECFFKDVFKTAIAKDILRFAESQWGERPEFLWKRFPDYAVLRRKGTGKWYALIARLTADKIGGDKNTTIEIVNLRRTDGIEGVRFLPAYHMNKKSWATIALDEAIAEDGLMPLLAASREKAV